MRLRNYADSFGKGVGIQKWVVLGPPFISCWASSAAQLKLRKRINRYFLLVQFNTALQISVAETQEYLSNSNPTQSLDSKSFGESLQRLEKHHRVGFILPPLSLAFGLKQWSLWILFLKFLPQLLWGTDIFILLKHFFFHSELAQVACFPPKTSSDISQNYEKIQHTSRTEAVEVSCCSWVIFVLCAIFIFVRAFPS